MSNHHYNKEELVRLKRKYDTQIEKEYKDCHFIEDGYYINQLEQENERLHSIIKEVREYCKNRVQYFDEAKLENWNYSTNEEYSIDNILEILDKENK